MESGEIDIIGGFTRAFEVSLKQQNLSIFFYASICEPSNSWYV